MNLTELFTSIANAIRTKKGTTELINATDFPNEIANLKTNNAKITNASGLFYNGARLEYMNEFLSLCENITATNNMFYKCNLTSLDLSGLLDTSEVTSMSSMFNSCEQLTQLNLSGCYTTKVTNMNSMFAYCKKLKKLDIRNFTFDKVTNNQTMFSSVPNSCEIIVKSDTEKQWVLARRSDFTNVKTVAELGG